VRRRATLARFTHSLARSAEKLTHLCRSHPCGSISLENAWSNRQLKSTIAQQMEAVTARLKEHHAQIQKVGAQIELQKPPAQTVVKNR